MKGRKKTPSHQYFLSSKTKKREEKNEKEKQRHYQWKQRQMGEFPKQLAQRKKEGHLEQTKH